MRRIIELAELEKAGSVDELAKQQDIKGNAIYKRIEALTKSFGGFPLVYKRHASQRRAGRLTPAADQLLRAAEEFQAAALRAYRRADLDADHEPPDIRIAAPQALAIHFFPTWLAAYKAAPFPKLQISIAAANVMDCFNRFKEGQADFLLWWRHSSLKGPPLSEYEALRLTTDLLVPVCRHSSNKDRPGRNDSDLEPILSDLAANARLRLPVLNYAQGTSLCGGVEHIIKHSGLADRVDFGHQADSAGALKQMVRHGLGIAWIPEHTFAGSRSLARIDEEIRRRERERPGAFEGVDPDNMTIPLDIFLIRRPGPRRPGPRTAFWTNATKLASQIKTFSTADT